MNKCQCIKCVEENEKINPGPTNEFGPINLQQFFACQICGNKRCPHSDNHNNPCTGSNEIGQQGSRYSNNDK